MSQSKPKSHAARDRFHALDEARQKQLLDPAEAEFAAHGYNAASLNRILADAAMSKGQAYYYFRNKADLYCLVCERVFKRLTKMMGGWTIDFESADAFWASVDHLFFSVTMVCMQDESIADIGRTVYSSEGAYQALAEPTAQLQIFVGETVQKGQNIGAIRTDLPVSLLSSLLFAHLGAMDRWFAFHMADQTPAEITRLIEVNRQLFRDIASPPKSQSMREENQR